MTSPPSAQTLQPESISLAQHTVNVVDDISTKVSTYLFGKREKFGDGREDGDHRAAKVVVLCGLLAIPIILLLRKK